MLFNVQDYANQIVTLTRTTWIDKLLHPVFGHPEIKPFLSHIKKTVQNPDYVFQSFRDPRSKLFITKISHGKFASYFLVVVVKYIKEEDQIIGYISTAMINRKLPKTRIIIWERKNLI